LTTKNLHLTLKIHLVDFVVLYTVLSKASAEGGPYPSGFSHIMQQMFDCLYNKHSFCKNISTLANHRSSLLQLLTDRGTGRLKPSGELATNFFAQKCSNIFGRVGIFSGNSPNKAFSFTQSSVCYCLVFCFVSPLKIFLPTLVILFICIACS